MVVCVEPEAGYFFRINTEGKWRGSVPIKQADNPFLRHDSYLECGGPLDLDEYIVSEALRAKGIIGRVHDNAIADIIAALQNAYTVSPADREMICAVLRKI